MKILNISENDVHLLINDIAQEFNIKDLSKIQDIIIEKREYRYRSFIHQHFPKYDVVEILHNISTPNDELVFNRVTDNATIPTIYEYMLTIAWFYLSKNKNYHLHKCFGASLDGNKLALSHKGGGSGDIEIFSTDYKLLIEETLMDKSTQRRGELELVIRHSINFAIDNTPDETITIFIANELNDNVINIFRSTQFIKLNGTIDTSEMINVLNIFALTTSELMHLLENDINDQVIIESINNNVDTQPIITENNWTDIILSEIMM